MLLDEIRKNTQYSPLKEAIEVAKFKEISLYLVGGYIRDKLLNNKSVQEDYDLVVNKDVFGFAQLLSDKLEGKYILLDEEEGIIRIVYNNKNIDISKLKGKDIFEDLKKRDFTINAIAVDLIKFILHDPYGGISDILEKKIRIVDEDNFLEDSLRMLRALRFAITLSFFLHPQITNIIKKNYSLINKASVERIVYELFLILSCDNSYKIIELMHKLNLFLAIFPEFQGMEDILQDESSKINILSHTFLTLKEFENLINNNKINKIFPFPAKINNYLSESLYPLHTRKSILKLACLFHDIGKPKTYTKNKNGISFYNHAREGELITQNICKRLKLSKKETQLLRRIVRHHMRPGYLAEEKNISDRAIYKLICELGFDCIGLFLVALADFYATPYFKDKTKLFEEKIKELFIRFDRHTSLLQAPRLITGYDIIEKFNLKPGPIIGKLLSKVNEACATGEISTKKEALKLIERCLAKNYKA